MSRNQVRPGSVLMIATVLVVGCGKVAGVGKKKSASSPEGATASSPASAPTASYHFTASYKPRTVDVLVIRDDASHNGVIDQRLQDGLQVLADRLWNLSSTSGNVHVGVFDQYYAPDSGQNGAPPPDIASPITDTQQSAAVLETESVQTPAFNTALVARAGTAGTRGGESRPASVFMAALTESQKPNGGAVNGLFRADSFWAVLFITAGIDPADPYESSDVLTALTSHGAVAFSALTLPKDDCVLDPTANPPTETNASKLQQRNLELKLAAATHGVTDSVCDTTYSIFMDSVVRQGTGAEYFDITLQAALKIGTITITTDKGTTIKDFAYIPGSTHLEVSTAVLPGDGFTVTGVPDTTTPTPVVATLPGDPPPESP